MWTSELRRNLDLWILPHKLVENWISCQGTQSFRWVMPRKQGKYSQIQFAYLIYFEVFLIKKQSGCGEGENARCQKTGLKSLRIDGWFLKLATRCLHIRFGTWRKETRSDDIRPIVVDVQFLFLGEKAHLFAWKLRVVQVRSYHHTDLILDI